MLAGNLVTKLVIEHVTKVAIHWTKISGNSGTKSNGTERFWKLNSKVWITSRGCPFSGNLEILGNFLFH